MAAQKTTIYTKIYLRYLMIDKNTILKMYQKNKMADISGTVRPMLTRSEIWPHNTY